MAKIRKEYKNGFTTVGNDMYRDKELTLKDRGLLGTMMSLPEDWNFSIAGLSSILSEGETAVRTCLTHLEKLGYLRRQRVYKNGKVCDWEYIFSDYRVFPNKDELVVENQQLGFQQLENLNVDNLDVGISTQLNKQELNNKELNDDDIASEIIASSANHQLRILEANSYSEAIRKKISEANTLVLEACRSLDSSLTKKLRRYKHKEKIWLKAFELVDEGTNINNKVGYLYKSIINQLKGGQD